MKNRCLRVVGFGLLAVAAFAGFGAAVMLLWNAIVPDVFGLITVNFWQAIGLLLLIRILFGGMGSRHRMFGRGHIHHGNHIREKWMKMTPEQRAEFAKRRGGLMGRGRCGHGDFFHGHDFGFDPHDTSKNSDEQ